MLKPFQHLELVRNGVVKFNDDALGSTVSQTGCKAGIDINDISYRFSTKPMGLELATANTTLVPLPVSSGLYYYSYRFYSPNMGRWINKDPIREQGGQNLYNFVGNDEVGFLDLSGLATVTVYVDRYARTRAIASSVPEEANLPLIPSGNYAY